jgi:hypothetical protein
VLKHLFYSENITDFNVWVNEINKIADEITDNIAPVKLPLKCVFLSRKNVIIPKSVFSMNNIKSYISLFFQLDELDEIQYRYIPEIDGYCCYALPSPVVSKIISRFGNADFYNQTYQIIRRINGYKTGMIIMFCDNFMDVSIFQNNKLILNNSFEIFDVKDIIYFISAVSAKFDVKGIPIYMSGNISNSDVKKLTNFFPSIVMEQDRKIRVLLGSEVAAKYYNLLLLQQCE